MTKTSLSKVILHCYTSQLNCEYVSRVSSVIGQNSPTPQENNNLNCLLARYQVVHLETAPNRPFPSSLVPLFQNESKCEAILMKMSSACSFISMQIKVIGEIKLDVTWSYVKRQTAKMTSA